MKRKRSNGVILALVLMGAQAAAVGGMIGTAALMESGQERLEQTAESVVEVQHTDEDCGGQSDPLRLILF